MLGRKDKMGVSTFGGGQCLRYVYLFLILGKGGGEATESEFVID
jgi:hypothetical protein